VDATDLGKICGSSSFISEASEVYGIDIDMILGEPRERIWQSSPVKQHKVELPFQPELPLLTMSHQAVKSTSNLVKREMINSRN
jgi:hypothetical protein